MKITDMTDTLFAREVERLAGDVQFWAIRLQNAFGPNTKIELSPVSYLDGTGEQPYPLAIDLWEVWEYARGTGPRPEAMEDVIQSLCELLWAPVGGTSYQIPPTWWEEPLGFMCRLAEARATLEAGADLTPTQLAALGGVTEHQVRLLCRQEAIDGKREDKGWIIPNAEAQKWLENKR